MKREQIIKNYFKSWLNKNSELLKNIFDSNATYSECYGPEYYGIDTIGKWFNNWNKRGSVLQWNIKQIIHQGSITVVEWYFRCV